MPHARRRLPRPKPPTADITGATEATRGQPGASDASAQPGQRRGRPTGKTSPPPTAKGRVISHGRPLGVAASRLARSGFTWVTAGWALTALGVGTNHAHHTSPELSTGSGVSG